MTRDLLNIGIATLLSCLADVDAAPEGHAYLGLQHAGYTLDDFHFLIGVLVEAKFITREPGPCIRITDAGRAASAKIDAALAGAR